MSSHRTIDPLEWGYAKAWELSFGALEGEALLRSMIVHAFPGRMALVSSFGAEAVLLLAMVAGIDPTTPVIFLDTGQHFDETLDYRDRLTRLLGLTDVRSVAPDADALATADPDGRLWRSASDRCCALRKVAPLTKALQGFDAWVTGRKRYQGGARGGLPPVEYVDARVKVNPLAGWDAARVNAEIDARGLPRHPLVAVGYGSIGCAPCTVPAALGSRAGRWAGLDKSECGIHREPDQA